MREGQIIKGEHPFTGHILIKERGYLYIYHEDNQIINGYTLKLKDYIINEAKAMLMLRRLNLNTHPAEVILNHFKMIKDSNDEIFNHPIFDKLKGRKNG